MNYGRKFNFSPGPAIMPESVLKKAADEMLNYQGTGISVMEMSHRSKEFEAILKGADDNLRKLLNIPDTYAILYLQGGAHYQFSAIPLNLLGDKKKADYIITGSWSERAAKEAEKYCEVNVVTKPTKFNTIPDKKEWKLSPDAAYVYMCDNETIFGVEFPDIPDTGDIPLVADMSSNFLSRPFDITKFGLVYACAQKNFGMAGLTIVVVRKDLIGNARKDTPMLMDYKLQFDSRSLYNTPSTYCIYIAALIFDWMVEQGGLEAFDKLNKEKSKTIYDAIENSNGFFYSPVDAKCRSRMNIPFLAKDTSLEKLFMEEAGKLDLIGLQGHRSVGAFRASIYNAFPLEGCKKLATFMKDFQEKHEKK
ncbi:phosphoserine aminotransferase [Anaeramoeba ignava]|uniref:Phosphoserine aminotransferase n=1 Tax=Anaeramoeba ignava TaxID=1746090 RepID=A0A9Q0LCF9_ANAIG|nr:phosphoserine aminotransferase [Anaeramoeba ignava]|eukprot:Anaeramoba_ignava/a609292_616.p1 GENE.a609292_616~~a609292_616.p1  ORF type:complete len:364 (+),score=109.84 a609292_616:69-1160(+)